MSRKIGSLGLKKNLAFHLETMMHMCNIYDIGDEGLAYTIVPSIRTICKGLGKSKDASLLGKLKKTDIRIRSLGGTFKPGAIFYDRFGLVGGTNIKKVLPNFDNGVPTPVKDWWHDVILLKAGEKITRSNIVETAGDKEVCHADETLPDAYARLKFDGLYHYKTGPEGAIIVGNALDHSIPTGFTPYLGSHLVAIRCIAGELLQSEELLDLAKF